MSEKKNTVVISTLVIDSEKQVYAEIQNAGHTLGVAHLTKDEAVKLIKDLTTAFGA